jgi:hypothetical protein
MTAATALVRDADSYRRLRLFAHGLNGLATLLLCVLLIPAVFDPLFLGVLALPHEVADIVYGSLWIYLPWAAAIGYRRFIHGVMIISGKTRQVALGTVFRLAAMAGTAFALAAFTELPGAWVAAAGLTAGVCIEAVAARLMATGAIRRTLATSTAESGTPPLTWSAMLSFYYPLALTSMVALATHPVLTFLVGRARAPLESLAVLPVIHSLSFLFRAIGLSYQEAAIALMGREFEHRRTVARYAVVLAIVTSAGYALFAVTPLFDFWFGTVSALTPELRRRAQELTAGYRFGPLYEPPSMEGTIAMPGILGGGNWGGVAVDPASAVLFVKSSEEASLLRIAPANPATTVADYAIDRTASRTLTVDGLPISNPPYGTLTAIDMNGGAILWQEAVGERPEIAGHPALSGLDLPARLGVVGAPGPFATAGGLVFLTGGSDILYAFDAATGEVLWEGRLPARAYANPMTFETRDGRQLVVIATGEREGAALLAYGL